jgi:glutamine amidotransferase
LPGVFISSVIYKEWKYMIGMIDYDAGNIRSVEKALHYLGEETIVTRDPKELLAADKVILPGVGSFGDCMENLKNYGLIPVIHEIVERGTPFLGICLGLQLLFESSEESPGVEGLGILKGKILRIPPSEGLKIPHMGWNSLHLMNEGRLFRGIPEDTYVYFVHSYYLQAEDPQIVKAVTDYSTCIHASVEQGNVFACQFHPEKSSKWGLKILQNFAGLGKEEA